MSIKELKKIINNINDNVEIKIRINGLNSNETLEIDSHSCEYTINRGEVIIHTINLEHLGFDDEKEFQEKRKHYHKKHTELLLDD